MRASTKRPRGRPRKVPLAPPTDSIHLWLVDLATLFAEAGNRVRERSNGTLETGHEPHHHSKSGTCVLIVPATGRWFCRSCQRAGDA